MSARRAPYPAYKDSGIDWLGALPEAWGVSKLGFHASVKARLGWKGLKAEEYRPEGYILLATPNLKGREIDYQNVNYISEDRYLESPEIMLREGDVLVAKDGSTLGIVNHVRSLPMASTVNSSIAVIRANTDRLVGRFLLWLIASPFTQGVIQGMKDGQGVPHLFQADLRKFWIWLPPLPEQRAIAAFLDRETARIDGLIAKKERQIELLQEKRAALISHAVTKGLDPNAKMKDSGIEWLGEVPEGWEVKRLKFCISGIEQGWSPQCDNLPADDEEWGVLKVGAVNHWQFRPEENKRLPPQEEPRTEYEIRPGDLLISRANTRELLGSASLVREVRSKLLLCDKLYRVQLRKRILDAEYVLCFLRSKSGHFEFERDATGSSASMQNIGQDSVRELLVPIPPLPEQQAVAAFLERETARIDTMAGKIRQSIDRLREYRESVISAVVTGRIDVREEVA